MPPPTAAGFPACAATTCPPRGRLRTGLRPGSGGLIVLALLGAPAARADEALSTDRPDFVESSDVVGAGRVQLEGGLVWERDRSGTGTRTRSTPVLLRVGLAPDWEARIETDGALSSLSDGVRVRGSADASLGLKWHQRDGQDGQPALAWLAHLDLDSGSAAFRGNGKRPSLRLVAEWELADDTAVGVMPGLQADRDTDGTRFYSGILAVTASRGLAPGWRGFVEWAGQQLTSARHGGSVISADAGVTWLLSDSLQLDLAASRGIGRSASVTQWGVGVSVRF